LAFEPILLEKVWGGRRLTSLEKTLPDGAMIGESWEVADLAATSTSGAGGGAQRSVVVSGPMAGRTLREVCERWGDALAPGSADCFPLLVKYLDAREHLSVQVHPSPAYAASHPEAHLKTECWYVIDADEGSRIFKGLRPGVTRSDLRSAIEAGTVPEVLASVPAVPGEMHELPSGTVHALGAGVLVAEVQTPSDTTFRVYDWAKELGRAGRELHIEQAIACVELDEPPPAMAGPGMLCENEFFRVREVRGDRGTVELGLAGCAAVMVVGGSASSVESKTGAFDAMPSPLGTTVLVPAACAGDVALRSGSGSVCLVCEVL
ncbi:MAG: type I phosphomannose isomerase catalytic subunit, partial [Planctomycetota bacterium]